MPKIDFYLSKPMMNAAGFLGFYPDMHGPINFSSFGAFVTNPISLKPRSPAHGRRFLSFQGGILQHTGFPNPGLHQVIRKYAVNWEHAALPVIVHLLVDNVDDVYYCTKRLEGIGGVAGIELGILDDADPQLSWSIIQAAYGELPLIVQLPINLAVELIKGFLHLSMPMEKDEKRMDQERKTTLLSRIVAFSLGPPRGALPATNGELIEGRLYGPALYPFALQTIHKLVKLGIPVIGAGGVYTTWDADTMLTAGALAVQLDAVLWGIQPLIG